MDDFAIYAHQLTYDFGALRAVDHLELAVATGARLSLFGPHGAGKSTILHLLLGQLAPSDGYATVLGYDTRTQGDFIRRHTQILTAQDNLDNNLSVGASLAYDNQGNARVAAAAAELSQKLLARFDLENRREQTLAQLTPLQRRRLALMRACLPPPLLLLMDEPGAGLSLDDARLLREDIARLVAEGNITLIVATSQLSEAQALTDAVVLMEQGRIVAGPLPLRPLPTHHPYLEIKGRGLTAEVVNLVQRRHEVMTVEQGNNRLRLLLAAGCDSAPIVTLLVEAGVEIEEVRRYFAPLEMTPLYVASTQPLPTLTRNDNGNS